MVKILLTILRSQWDRVSAIVLVVAGAATLINGWVGVSGSAYAAEQIPYVVSGGLVGIFCLGLAAVLWLSADLRDEWRKLDELARLLPEAVVPRTPGQGRAPAEPTSPGGVERVASDP